MLPVRLFFRAYFVGRPGRIILPGPGHKGTVGMIAQRKRRSLWGVVAGAEAGELLGLPAPAPTT